MFKHIFQTLIAIVCILTPALARGGMLTADEAKMVAAGFFRSGGDLRLSDAGSLTLAHVVKSGHRPVCYVFNATDGKGFAIVSADDTAVPVIGYSTTSVWKQDNIPSTAAGIVANTIRPADNNGRQATRKPARAPKSTRKLLNTPTWSQEAPFNNRIPGHRLAGCVGTALAEILKYHRHPAARPAALVGNGETTAYDWDNMRADNYRAGYTSAEADAVATLVADAATAIGTDFGMSSSSAFEVRVPDALIRLFGYDAGVSYKKSAEMDKASWETLITTEIDNNRPVLYCGQDVSAGHSFVCDGYEMRGSTPYFHINWGWGGAADGFYASDALNPTVSQTHNFNELTTVVYNIKPSESAKEWSPIHLTSDERQIGMTLDVTDIKPGEQFSVRAGALKNITPADFRGLISVALFSADGNIQHLLHDGKRITLQALQILKYTDIQGTVPAGVTVGANDVIRLVTKSDDSSDWIPVANDLMTLGEARAKGNVIPCFNINMPANIAGVEITTPGTQVIKGRDYSFSVTPMSPDKVVTVKANGFILTPDTGYIYRLRNVNSDQKVTVVVQNAADVISKRTLWVQAGNLAQLIGDTEAGTITDLTLYGTIDANDFTFIRERMRVSRLDMSGVSVTAKGANPANAIPAKAFSGYGSLRQIILPKTITAFKSGCFSGSGLESIEIPASVSTYEYNIFLNCGNLREVIVRRTAPAWVNWCVFQGTPKARLVVPVGTSAAYMGKDYWKDFRDITEENPAAATHYTVTVQEMPGVLFTPLTDSAEAEPGSRYEFKVTTDDAYGDATIEIYANNTRLTPGAGGVYTATVNSNTFIHANFRQPAESGADSPWKITSAAGGIGLVGDVVNVVPGKTFTIRANALAIPSDNADTYYCAALTDKDGRIKELISPVVYNNVTNYGNLPCTFTCQVKDATVREGNLIRVVTSLDKKMWSLVNAAGEGVADRLDAIANRVVYHTVNVPRNVSGAVIQGGASQVVRGMPFSLKVTPVSVDDRITVAVNGINKIVDSPQASLSIPAVTEDLDITIQVNPKGSTAYTVVNVREGELDTKIAQCPARLKVVGTIKAEEFAAFRKHAGTITDLDLADVTITGTVQLANAIPEYALASPTAPGSIPALRNIVLPAGLERIQGNAFYRCVNMSQITIPASVTYVGENAFFSSSRLKKIIMLGSQPPLTGNMSPFPSNTSGITLEIPKGSEKNYSTATWWQDLNRVNSAVYFNIQIDPARSFNYNSYYTLTKIEYDGSMRLQVTVGLPNSTSNTSTLRKGVPFKLYDNGIDLLARGYTYIQPGSAFNAGQYSVKFDPKTQDPAILHYPQNHNIEVVFHYPVTFHTPDGVTTAFEDLDEKDVWADVDMSAFDSSLSDKATVYREGRDYKFSMKYAVRDMKPKVRAVSRIITVPGVTPVYEVRETFLTPDEYGIYTIRDLQGHTEVHVSMIPDDGAVLSSADIDAVSAEDARTLTGIGLTGDIDDTAFAKIRDVFSSLETLDMSDMRNQSIPDNTFAGMDNLRSVVIPDNVVSIGEGAFAGCSELETVTLPGVDAIGQGAFDGCGSLTSISVLGNSDEAIAPASSRREAPRTHGISEASFRGINPNCLIYIPANMKDAAGATRNIIINSGTTRVAASDIVLQAGHPFNAPASFSLDGHDISLTLDIPGDLGNENGGWQGIVIPFTPDKITYAEGFTPRDGNPLTLFTFAADTDTDMTRQTSVEANRPYMASLHAPVDKMGVTFSASGRKTSGTIVYDVPYTPAQGEVCARGLDFTLHGSYNGSAGPEEGDIYLPDSDGVAFSHAAADIAPACRPFTVYARANRSGAPGSFGIGTHPVWVFNPGASHADGSELYRSDAISLTSPTSGATVYYTVDGTDPTDAGDTRTTYTSPFTLDTDNTTVRAVASLKGNLSETVSMTYTLRKTDVGLTLSKGWNWLSHDIETPIPATAIFTPEVSRVVSQTAELIRDPQYGLTGNLANLTPLEAYKVFADESSDTAVKGIAFDPATPVSIVKGWNWIGCPTPAGGLALDEALAGMDAAEGDMIVGREGFAQAGQDGKWTGTLSHLTAGCGYMLRSNGAKTFTYNTAAPDAAPRKSMACSAADGSWTPETYRYPSVMPVIAQVMKSDGMPAADGEYIAGAFCGDECRGAGVYVDGLLMISVFGDKGDQICFRLSRRGDDSFMTLRNTLAFTEDGAGSLFQPFVLDVSDTVSAATVIDGNCTLTVENGTLVIGGGENIIKVEVFDDAGLLEAVAAGAGNSRLTVPDLRTGVHVAVIHTAGGNIHRKFVVK